MTALRVKNESGHPLTYATDGSIGLDLRACIDTERYVQPGSRWKFDTGIRVEIPDGYGGLVEPRSGLGLHQGIVCLTGVIDRDFRGRIAAVLVNIGRDPYKVLPGERIAQLVIVRMDLLPVIEVDELTKTARGDSGFGSTGR